VWKVFLYKTYQPESPDRNCNFYVETASSRSYDDTAEFKHVRLYLLDELYRRRYLSREKENPYLISVLIDHEAYRKNKDSYDFDFEMVMKSPGKYFIRHYDSETYLKVDYNDTRTQIKFERYKQSEKYFNSFIITEYFEETDLMDVDSESDMNQPEISNLE
jgi:hypothetical protein